MGTTVTSRRAGESVTESLINAGALRWTDRPQDTHSYTVLAGSLVNLTEHYAAIEIREKATQEARVVCIITKVRLFKEDDQGYNFAYKGIGHYDSYYLNCPQRILDLLSPAVDAGDIEWRAATHAKAEENRQMKLSAGTRFYTKNPIKFASATLESEFIVKEARGPSIICEMLNQHQRCRISRDFLLNRFRNNELAFTPYVIPEPEVRQTANFQGAPG